MFLLWQLPPHTPRTPPTPPLFWLKELVNFGELEDSLRQEGRLKQVYSPLLQTKSTHRGPDNPQ